MPDRRPKVLFAGRGRYRLPLPAWLAKKWDAVEELIDYRVFGAAEPGGETHSERFHLSAPVRPQALNGALFQACLPLRLRRQIVDFRPDAIVAGDPFVGAAALAGRRLARTSTPIIVEVHGDWRTFTRSYGSGLRRLLSIPADKMAVGALRRADAVRALSDFTSSLVDDARGEPATMSFPTYSDLQAFTERPLAPLPERPTALFVGVLEAYKNVDGLASAWRRVAAALPGARLVIVGTGSRQRVVDALLADLPDQVEYHRQLLPTEVAAALDNATVLVLPSWPEGLGRVVIEAFARGRGVVATGAGGVLDLVEDGVEGLLVPPADEDAFVAALLRVLPDRELATRLGAAAQVRYADWHSTPEQFAQQLRALVDDTIARTRK
jgi:glycosyltransferase involved in cell wall biosynthesis